MAATLLTSPPQISLPCRFALVKTVWGHAAFMARGETLVRLFLPDRDRSRLLKTIRAAGDKPRRDDEVLPELRLFLENYFNGTPAAFTGSIDISWAGPFGRKVLAQCHRIKPGQTLTYGRLAEKAGSARAARAVGSVMASNPTPLVIPCHRVVGANGVRGGFSAPGGLKTKLRLLSLEKSTWV